MSSFPKTTGKTNVDSAMDIEIVSSVAIDIKKKEAVGALVVFDFTVVGIDQWRAETRHGDPLPNDHRLSEAGDDKFFMAIVQEPLYLVLRGGGGKHRDRHHQSDELMITAPLISDRLL